MSTSSTEKPGVGEEIYSGAASFGVFWALLGAVMATIVGIILIIAGIYILASKSDRNSASATVVAINGQTNGSCQKTQDNPVQYQCTVSVKYDGWKDPIDINYSGNNSYYVGEKLTIYVKKNDPSDATLNPPVPKWFGIIAIVVGLIIPAVAWFWYWASRRWKFIAAAEGASGAFKIISGGRL